MRHQTRRAALIGRRLAWAALLCLGGAPAQAVEGAAQVVDGQTLAVAGQRFHLQGVVAPALDQVCHRARKPYPCGRVARAALWELIGGRDVTCTPAPDAAAAAGALPATCTAGDASLAEGMVRSGWALADRATGASYEALEKEAEQAGRGIWRSAFELPGAPPAKAE
jgi:endonuclease YncB( thermonuclease family)